MLSVDYNTNGIIWLKCFEFRVWKFALSMRARECESKAHLFSIKMQFTCNTMRTLNTNHTDVFKENNKKGAKKRVQNLIFQTIPMEFIYIFHKRRFRFKCILYENYFFWICIFFSYGLYTYVRAANTWSIQWKLWWQGFSNDIHLHCLTCPKPSHRAYIPHIAYILVIRVMCVG